MKAAIDEGLFRQAQVRTPLGVRTFSYLIASDHSVAQREDLVMFCQHGKQSGFVHLLELDHLKLQFDFLLFRFLDLNTLNFHIAA